MQKQSYHQNPLRGINYNEPVIQTIQRNKLSKYVCVCVCVCVYKLNYTREDKKLVIWHSAYVYEIKHMYVYIEQ